MGASVTRPVSVRLTVAGGGGGGGSLPLPPGGVVPPPPPLLHAATEDASARVHAILIQSFRRTRSSESISISLFYAARSPPGRHTKDGCRDWHGPIGLWVCKL